MIKEVFCAREYYASLPYTKIRQCALCTISCLIIILDSVLYAALLETNLEQVNKYIKLLLLH